MCLSNAPFKKRITSQGMEWRCQPNERKQAGNLKQPTRQDVINWVSEAWADIPEEIFIKAFLRCTWDIKQAEDDLICEEIPKDSDSNDGDESEGQTMKKKKQTGSFGSADED